RKVENAQNRVLLPNSSTSDVNVLNGTMIRKKPKPDMLLAEPDGSNTNILGNGFLRKKPKA
ncbi:hypothetical protein LTR16_012237, partial [Cryomyces antarcticus]